MLKPLIAAWCDRVNFVTVYVREAHASDEWRLGSRVEIRQHQSLEERIQAAEQLRDGYDFNDCPIVVDQMDDNFCSRFAVWPERFFVVDGTGVIRHISMPTSEFGYNHRQLASEVAALFEE